MPTKGYGEREREDEIEHMGGSSNTVLETRKEFSKISKKKWFKFGVLESYFFLGGKCLASFWLNFLTHRIGVLGILSLKDFWEEEEKHKGLEMCLVNRPENVTR